MRIKIKKFEELKLSVKLIIVLSFLCDVKLLKKKINLKLKFLIN